VVCFVIIDYAGSWDKCWIILAEFRVGRTSRRIEKTYLGINGEGIFLRSERWNARGLPSQRVIGDGGLVRRILQGLDAMTPDSCETLSWV